MILECPACHAQFNVPDGAITAAGRKVKCSACANQWHATLASAAKPKPVPAPVVPEITLDNTFLEQLARASEATDAPEETVVAAPNEPVIEDVVIRQAAPPPKLAKQFALPFQIWPFKLAAPSLAVCWLALAMLAYFPSWTTGPLSGIYGMFGVVPTDGVVLADIAMQRQQEGQRTRFLISGNIVNQEADVREVPAVRIQMLDKENEVIWSRAYEVDRQLKPGEIYPFRITNAETSFANNVSQLVVDVGHPLQLMFR